MAGELNPTGSPGRHRLAWPTRGGHGGAPLMLGRRIHSVNGSGGEGILSPCQIAGKLLDGCEFAPACRCFAIIGIEDWISVFADWPEEIQGCARARVAATLDGNGRPPRQRFGVSHTGPGQGMELLIAN